MDSRCAGERTDEVPDELALIQSERISTQWTNELRKNIRVYPTCNILKATLSLDLYMQAVVTNSLSRVGVRVESRNIWTLLL
jgi:hypothetical protein